MNPEIEHVHFPNIACELGEMVEIDQTMRKSDQWDNTVDIKNTEQMKKIVSEIGWPTVSKVGIKGANNAWLLAQHADHDVDFQKHCLQLMKDASSGEVNKIDMAYLEDRVRVNQGKGQLYGTQFTQEGGKYIPIKIEDETNVDVRRAEIGMGSLSEQTQLMYSKYPIDDVN